MTKSVVRKGEHEISSDYGDILVGMIELLEQARHTVSRTVNTVITATYWEIGRRLVESEQSGRHRAEYGKQLLKQLSNDLQTRFGRGFSVDNLELMRLFFLTYSEGGISETLSRKSSLEESRERFSLPWSHYVLLLKRTRSPEARQFYEIKAMRGGWSVRQLERQVNSQFYERTLLSKNKAAMLTKGNKAKPEDILTVEEEIKDPFVLEFLGLKDEYSESDLEEALIRHLEVFLLELGSDFAFIGRQKRLRIGNQWFRVDLVFFHRRLRCLMIIELKLGVSKQGLGGGGVLHFIGLSLYAQGPSLPIFSRAEDVVLVGVMPGRLIIP